MANDILRSLPDIYKQPYIVDPSASAKVLASIQALSVEQERLREEGLVKVHSKKHSL